MEKHGAKRLSVGLPSLRIESFSVDLMDLLEKGTPPLRLHLCPEAANDRLRDVINKPIASADLLATAEEVYKRGLTIKMYFMIGHPTQTLEDVRRLPTWPRRCWPPATACWGKRPTCASGSALVPKPHTPFQWVPMEEEAVIRSQIELLQRSLRGPRHPLLLERPGETLVEAILRVATGGWPTSSSVPGSWGRSWRAGENTSTSERGSKHLPSWAWKWTGTPVAPRPLDELLPWDHISAGIKKQFAQEYVHSYQGVVDDCREHCFSCGILGYFREQRREASTRRGVPATRPRQGSPARQRRARAALLQRRDVARPHWTV